MPAGAGCGLVLSLRELLTCCAISLDFSQAHPPSDALRALRELSSSPAATLHCAAGHLTRMHLQSLRDILVRFAVDKHTSGGSTQLG